MSEQSVRPRYSRFSGLLQLGGHIPYGFGSRLIAAIGGVGPARRFILGRRLKVMQSLLPVIAPGLEKGRAERTSFAANALVPWRANALSRCSDTVFNQWVKVIGLEHIDRARKQGKGVVLISSHFSVNRLVPLVMLRKGYIVHAMEPEPWLLRMGVKGAESIPVIDLRAGEKFWLKELFKAKRVLDDGNILHLAVDGLQGRQGRKALFLGKEREFFVSFAELAVKTNSAAIVVFASIDPVGRITVEMKPALQDGDESVSHENRVSLLLDQYVAFLEAQWRADLGNVVPKHLHHYASLQAVV